LHVFSDYGKWIGREHVGTENAGCKAWLKRGPKRCNKEEVQTGEKKQKDDPVLDITVDTWGESIVDGPNGLIVVYLDLRKLLDGCTERRDLCSGGCHIQMAQVRKNVSTFSPKTTTV
jgi:hypothetical protein